MATSDSVVLEPTEKVVPKERIQQRQKPRHQKRFHVILWNDDDHTYEYVVVMLRELFGYAHEKGFQLAQAVDAQGFAVVMTTTKEHAELKRDQIHAYGRDSLIRECRGSMWATIESVDS